MVEIPGYKIEKELGAGGMATVYLALQESLHREVALKIMTPGLAVDETYCHRFLKEGRITASLNHRNLLTVYDTGVHENHYYMASEFLPGGTARDRMNAGMEVDEIVRIIGDIAQGLGYAHSHGFVHRDVKPGNMLFRANGDCVLGDFGIAKAVDSNTGATKLGTSIGTPHYMSPEQAKGEKVDHRTDLYSVGVVFFEMLTGKPPFDADDPFSVALMQINDPVPALPEKHQRFQPLIEKLMAKDRDQRYATAEEFLTDLAAVTGGQAPAAGSSTGVRATPEPKAKESGTRPSRAARKREASSSSFPLLRVAVIAVLLVAVGGSGYLVWSRFSQGQDEGGPIPTPPPTSVQTGGPATKDSTSDAEASDDEVGAWLAEARQHVDAGRLLQPAGRNALASYRQVLAVDDDNAAARAGLQELADRVEQAAEVAWASGELAEARSLLTRAVDAFPEDSGLRYLLDQVERQSAEQGLDEPAGTDEPVATAAPSGKVEELIRLGDKYFDANIFSHPPGENAMDVYLQVLEIDPDNERALSRLDEIADTWASAAETNLKRGKVGIARRMIDKGLSANPKHEKLLSLQKRAEEMDEGP